MQQQRRGFQQTVEQRLSDEAKRLREEADLPPPGALRQQALQRALQVETGAYVSKRLYPPEPPPQK